MGDERHHGERANAIPAAGGTTRSVNRPMAIHIQRTSIRSPNSRVASARCRAGSRPGTSARRFTTLRRKTSRSGVAIFPYDGDAGRAQRSSVQRV